MGNVKEEGESVKELLKNRGIQNRDNGILDIEGFRPCEMDRVGSGEMPRHKILKPKEEFFRFPPRNEG